MYCRHCGSPDQEKAFCTDCGKDINNTAPQAAPEMVIRSTYQPPVPTPPPPSQFYPSQQFVTPPSGFSTASMVLGILSFLFFPFILGVLGIIFGGIAVSKNQPRGVAGLVVSIIGTVLGTLITIGIFSA